MTSNAEKPDLTPLHLSNEAQLRALSQANQPDWDVQALFQGNSRQSATQLDGEPSVQGLDFQPTTYEILNKPLTSINLNDVGVMSNNALKLISSVDSDHAAMGGVFFRYKSEVLRMKFPANSSMIAGGAAVPLAGVAGFMLKSDVENFNKTTSIGQKGYYATAAALDTTALAATIGTLVPRTRAITGTTAALSFLGRAGIGLVHNMFFSEKE